MGTNMVDRAILPRYECKLHKIQRLKKEVYNDLYLKSLSLCGNCSTVFKLKQNTIAWNVQFWRKKSPTNVKISFWHISVHGGHIGKTNYIIRKLTSHILWTVPPILTVESSKCFFMEDLWDESTLKSFTAISKITWHL